MGKHAKTDKLLPNLVKLAVPTFRQAEQEMSRGRGAKPVIPDWVMAAMIMIVVLKKKKSKSAQFRFLSERRHEIADWLGYWAFPSRSTYFRRYRRAHLIFTTAVRLQGEEAISERIADPESVAGDKSLIQAQGQPWHLRFRRVGKVPAGVDTDGSWGYSEHDDWVFGFAYEVVVTATAGSMAFPLLASVASASTSETRTFPEKVKLLPEGTKNVLLDSAYDTNHLGELIEFGAEGTPTGRRLLCPPNPRNNKRPVTKPYHAAASRIHSRKLRTERIKRYQSKNGRRLYTRRSKSVEPFNQWFKSAFELEHRTWHRRLDNNRTMILSAIFAYQLMIRHNYRCGNHNGQIRWILDAL
jgi:hypothetical protein